jgi:hypothetical protein
MFNIFQATPTDSTREFDISIVWRTFDDLGESLLARLPYTELVA